MTAPTQRRAGKRRQFNEPWRFNRLLASLADGKQRRAIGNEQRVVGHDERGEDRVAHVDFRQNLLRLARLENGDVSVAVPDVNLAFYDDRGTPRFAELVVNPIALA